MRVRVCYTVVVSDEFRRALRSYRGGEGLATREELKEHFKWYGGLCDDDIMSEYAQKIEEETQQ